MSHTSSQAFLRELDMHGGEQHGRPSDVARRVRADRLRSYPDAAVYDRAVLGLIFLKYVPDSSARRQAEIAVGVPPSGSASLVGLAGRQIQARIRDPDSDRHLSRPADYGTFAKHDMAISAGMEERDYHIGKNVFRVPSLARWKTLQDSAKRPPGTEILVKGAQASCLSLQDGKATDGKATGKMPVLHYKFTAIGRLIDCAPEPAERENPKLKHVPVASVCDRRTLKSSVARLPSHSFETNRRLKRRKTSDNRRWRAWILSNNALNRRPRLPLQIDPANLAGLIDLIATIPFPCSGAASASHDSTMVADQSYIAKDIRGLIYQKGAQASRLFLPKQTAKMAVPLLTSHPNPSSAASWK